MATQKLLVERRKVNEGLIQDIRDIKEMLTKHLQEEAARAERERAILDDVCKLKEKVEGNGKLGLIKEVLILQQNEEKRREEEKRRSGLMYTVAGAVIIQIILMLFTKVF